jgi:hypothetical protein
LKAEIRFRRTKGRLSPDEFVLQRKLRAKPTAALGDDDRIAVSAPYPLCPDSDQISALH